MALKIAENKDKKKQHRAEQREASLKKQPR
jgi:hypothetical protein